MPVIQFIPQTYCRTCHLSTRMDIPRCLHCNQLLQPAPIRAVKKKTAKVSASARAAAFRVKLRVPAKRRQSQLAPARKAKSRHR
jgi:hypothetical protein